MQKEDYEYPLPVIREIIANAVVHRNYQVGASIFFHMYRDTIVLRSPGLPMKPLTIDMFPDDAVSVSRNPRIGQAAFDLGYMEARGLGIKTMPQRLKNHGLRQPEFRIETGFFVVTLFGREATPVRTKIPQNALAELNARQQELVDALELRKRITAPQWAQIANINRYTAKLDLERLFKLGIADRKGLRRGTFYTLK